MKRSYSTAFAPPAPVVIVGVRAPTHAGALRLEAKIDTGADMCTLPVTVVERLGLPRIRVVRVAGFSGAPFEVTVHSADFEVDETWLVALDVIPTERTYALLGRNFLRHAVARMDGPRAVLELKMSRKRKEPAPRARNPQR